MPESESIFRNKNKKPISEKDQIDPRELQRIRSKSRRNTLVDYLISIGIAIAIIFTIVFFVAFVM